MNDKVLQAVIKLKDQITTPLKNVNKSLRNVKKTFDNVSASAKEASDKMKDIGQVAVTTGASIAGSLTAITGAYVEQGAEINKISKMANMSTKSYQQWDKMLKSTGYSMEQANGDFAAMAERMAVTEQELGGLLESESDLTQIVKQLGLSVTDSNGKLKETGTFMNELMLATSKLENKTHQQAVMTALLSTTGEELLPHLDNWAEKAKELEGYSYISESQLQKIQQFKDKWNELKGKFDLVKNSIGQALMPTLEQLMNKISPVIDKIVSWINENPKLIQQILIFGGIVAGVGAVLVTIAPIVTGIILALKALGVICGVVAAAFAFICSPVGAVIAAIVAVNAAIAVVQANWGRSMNQLKADCKNAIDNIVSWWKNFVSIITSPVRAVVGITKSVLGGKSEGRNAFGSGRIARDGTVRTLHEGERVLTKQEANRYEKGTNTGVNIVINGLTVREEADITKIANKLVQKINQNKMVYGGAY